MPRSRIVEIEELAASGDSTKISKARERAENYFAARLQILAQTPPHTDEGRSQLAVLGRTIEVFEKSSNALGVKIGPGKIAIPVQESPRPATSR